MRQGSKRQIEKMWMELTDWIVLCAEHIFKEVAFGLALFGIYPWDWQSSDTSSHWTVFPEMWLYITIEGEIMQQAVQEKRLDVTQPYSKCKLAVINVVLLGLPSI